MDATKPPGLGERGSTFWDTVLDTYELGLGEVELLREVCRSLDLCDELTAQIERDGLVVRGSEGQPRANPLVTQLTAARRLLSLQIAQLQLPDEDDQVVTSPQSAQRQRAARSRWSGHDASTSVRNFRKGGPRASA